MNPKKAIAAIDEAGALLVFPMDNRKEPASLWSVFYPRSPMRWEWDADGDNRVANLWHLRSALSTTRKVVYTKWFRGRATYFSRSLFQAFLRALNPAGDRSLESVSPTARHLLGILESESPLSTKELKRISGLKGRVHEASYERALKELWSRLLIVAFGEVDDGAFPSLAVGATRVLYEDLWRKAFALDVKEAEALVARTLSKENLFFKHYQKLRVEVAPRMGGVKASAGKARALGKTKKIPSVVKFEEL